MWPPTASTLIHGERNAILVDPLMTIDESRPDGLSGHHRQERDRHLRHPRARRPLLRRPAVLDRFPNARIVATPGVMAYMAAPRGSTLVRRILEPSLPRPDLRLVP